MSADTVTAACWFFAGAMAYLLPTAVAAARKARSGAGIFLLNLLLGWTFLGWVVALIWAVVAEKEGAPTTPSPAPDSDGSALRMLELEREIELLRRDRKH